MKKVLIICYNRLESDPRVLRQIEALHPHYLIETLAYSPCNLHEIMNHQIYVLPKKNYFRKFKRLVQYLFRRFDNYYWDDYRKYLVENLKNKYDVIIANDYPTLPLALALSEEKGKVIFDSHDYHPDEFDDNIMWKLKSKPYVQYVCRKYIPQADIFITSSDSIAAKYKEFIGILPVVINNAREYYNTNETSVHSPIRLIHHGAAIAGRKLENMIQIAGLLGENFQLTLMLTNTGSDYYLKLKNYANKYSNINFHEPVSYNEIIPVLNNYDIGIYHLDESNTNNSLLLPNKIFEFIQARLCCIVTPTYELKKIVSENNIGLVAKDFSVLAMKELLEKLTINDIKQFKHNCNEKAFSLSSETNLILIKDLVDSIV